MAKFSGNKRRNLRNVKVNKDRDYIRVGSCNCCRRQRVSIVIHHPEDGGRSFAVCNYCSPKLWREVGASNKENYLKWGSVTKTNRKPHRRSTKN